MVPTNLIRRDPERIDAILLMIGMLWHEHPDWRLGQLIDNLATTTRPYGTRSVFYMEDGELAERVYHLQIRMAGVR